MIDPPRLAILGVSWLAWSTPLQAACTAEQITLLLGSGFNHEQVVQLCASMQPPGASKAPTDAAAAPAETDGSRFTSDVLEPELGDDGTWRKYVRQGTYVLQNKSDAGSGFILLSGKPNAGWRSFGVKVRFSHEKVEQGPVGPALVYESGPPGGDVVIFTLQVDGTVTALRGGSNGSFVPLASKQRPTFVVPDYTFVELGVRKRSGTAEFLVNGEGTGLTAPLDDDSTGSFGIAVFGVGSYEFRDFVAAGA
jgi:hypothetical protein